MEGLIWFGDRIGSGIQLLQRLRWRGGRFGLVVRALASVFLAAGGSVSRTLGIGVLAARSLAVGALGVGGHAASALGVFAFAVVAFAFLALAVSAFAGVALALYTLALVALAIRALAIGTLALGIGFDDIAGGIHNRSGRFLGQQAPGQPCCHGECQTEHDEILTHSDILLLG